MCLLVEWQSTRYYTSATKYWGVDCLDNNHIPMNTRLLHICLVSRSIENSDRFFVDILGLEKKDVKHLDALLSKQIFGFEKESAFVYYQNLSLVFEVFINDRKDTVENQIAHICLEITDRELLARKCITAGLEVDRIKKNDNILMFIRDFDGNLYEIKERVLNK